MWDRGKLPTNLRRGQNPSLCLQLAGLWFRWPAHDCVGPAAPQEAALHAHGTHCKYLLCQGEQDKPQSKWTRWLSCAHGCVCMFVSQVPLGITYTFDLSIWWWFLKPISFPYSASSLRAKRSALSEFIFMWVVIVGDMVLNMNLDSRKTCMTPLPAFWKLCEVGNSPDLFEPVCLSVKR